MATAARPASMIWLHGLGDSGAGWSDIQYQLGPKVGRHVKWVFPDAPNQAVTVNAGFACPSWFDITEMPLTPKSKDDPSIGEAVGRVHALLSREEEHGVPAERVLLGGFSQGGALSLCSGLQYPKKLGGIVAFSGWVLHKDQYPQLIAEAQKDTKVLACHGRADNTVLFDCGKDIAETLSINGISCDFKSYNMSHSACPEELAALAEFIKEVLPP